MTGRIEANGDQTFLVSLDREKSVIKGQQMTFSGRTLKSIDNLFISSISTQSPLSRTFFFPMVFRFQGEGWFIKDRRRRGEKKISTRGVM
jgi:hypothetical protein